MVLGLTFQYKLGFLDEAGVFEKQGNIDIRKHHY